MKSSPCEGEKNVSAETKSAPAGAKKKWLVGAVVAGAVLYWLSRGQTASAAVLPANKVAPRPTVQPAAVRAGEMVNATTFRRIAQRRNGFVYAPAQLSGGRLVFRSPVNGIFTRNVVQLGAQTLAEIQRR